VALFVSTQNKYIGCLLISCNLLSLIRIIFPLPNIIPLFVIFLSV